MLSTEPFTDGATSEDSSYVIPSFSFSCNLTRTNAPFSSTRTGARKFYS